MSDMEKGRGEKIQDYKELDVYQRAMSLAMEIFEISKMFPKEEKYSLTDQIRRSSRSVCANLGETWRKRRYEAAFIAKLNDAETEACETQVWCEFSSNCKYITPDQKIRIATGYDRVIGQIVSMINQPEKWILKANKHNRPVTTHPVSPSC